MKGRRIFAILVVAVLLCILLSGNSYRGTDENAGVTFPVLTDMVLDSVSPEFYCKILWRIKGGIS